MISLVIGILFLVGVAIFTFKGGDINLSDSHSLALVVGGTIAVFFLSTPLRTIQNVLRSLRDLLKNPVQIAVVRSQLISLAKKGTISEAPADPLIQYAVDLWEQGMAKDLFENLLAQRIEELTIENQDAIQSLKNLSKYPPALGMTGTVIGMIGLFSKIDSANDGIGFHLALAMIATFLGLIMTNAVISPLADRIQLVHFQINQTRNMIYNVLILINKNELPSLIEDEVRNHAA